MAKIEKLANAAGLGLAGFGMTTVLLNIHNFLKGIGLENLFPAGSMLLAMGICYGGLAQIIAGIMEYRNQDIFGMTAFLSYGLFWWSLVALLTIPHTGFGKVFSPSHFAIGWYLFFWGVFTTLLFIGTLAKHRSLQVVFLTLFILFYLLAIANWSAAGGWEAGRMFFNAAGGIIGLICGLTSMYTAAGIVLNEVYGRAIIPL